LARELATRTDLQMIGVERDPARVAAAREMLDSIGLYGPRVVVHEQTGDRLPYPPGFANLVVCESLLETGQLPASVDEVAKVLRPCGGLVVLVARGDQVTAAELKTWGEGRLPDWRVVQREDWLVGVGRRDALRGSGEWTHTYADPANTSCSGDRLVGSTPRLQWFGEPGPRRMVDRHIRNVPPLYKDGRLFVPGDQVVFAVDAYNGTPLWNAEVPNSRRLGVFLDTSNLVVDSRALYVVAGRECRLFDVRTGQPLGSYQAPAAADGHATEWGYLARAADLVLGSIRREGTTYRQITREAELDGEPVWYPNMKLATSDSLFALDSVSGKTRWTYRSGRVIDTTLTVAGNRLFFLENDAAASSTSGRVAMREIAQSGQSFLVALDLGTGDAVFRKPIDVRSFQQPAYLSSSAGRVAIERLPNRRRRTHHCKRDRGAAAAARRRIDPLLSSSVRRRHGEPTVAGRASHEARGSRRPRRVQSASEPARRHGLCMAVRLRSADGETARRLDIRSPRARLRTRLCVGPLPILARK
jgi:outer membrane protein assembly factor BamB